MGALAKENSGVVRDDASFSQIKFLVSNKAGFTYRGDARNPWAAQYQGLSSPSQNDNHLPCFSEPPQEEVLHVLGRFQTAKGTSSAYQTEKMKMFVLHQLKNKNNLCLKGCF